MDNRSDEELLWATWLEQVEAFDELYHRYNARAMILDRTIPIPGKQGNFREWFFSLIRHCADFPHHPPTPAWAAADSDLDLAQEDSALLAKIRSLSRPRREVVYLTIFEHMPASQVASILLATEDQVREWAESALEELASFLQWPVPIGKGVRSST